MLGALSKPPRCLPALIPVLICSSILLTYFFKNGRTGLSFGLINFIPAFRRLQFKSFGIQIAD